jgi:hypothetical protein
VTLAELRDIAIRWNAAGRPAEQLEANPWWVMAWALSVTPLRRSPVSLHVVTLEYIDACLAAKTAADPRWKDHHLSERSVCDRCGERYRIESLVFCTACRESMCYRCGHSGDPLKPGARDICGEALLG